MYSTRSNLALSQRGREDLLPESVSPGRGVEYDDGDPDGWLSPASAVATPHVIAACHSTSVYRCGGDLCAIYPLGDAVLVVIGDVTGHEYDAALVCAMARGACDVAVSEIRPLGPQRLLEVLDRAIRRAAPGRIRMSCAVALVGSRGMTVASAGHPLPYVLRDGGERIEGVRSFGALLGTGQPASYETTTVALRPGARVLWYTDGVLDTVNEIGARFGHRRLRAVLKRGHGLGARPLVEELAAQLFWFRGDATISDDASFAVAEIR